MDATIVWPHSATSRKHATTPSAECPSRPAGIGMARVAFQCPSRPAGIGMARVAFQVGCGELGVGSGWWEGQTCIYERQTCCHCGRGWRAGGAVVCALVWLCGWALWVCGWAAASGVPAIPKGLLRGPKGPSLQAASLVGFQDSWKPVAGAEPPDSRAQGQDSWKSVAGAEPPDSRAQGHTVPAHVQTCFMLVSARTQVCTYTGVGKCGSTHVHALCTPTYATPDVGSSKKSTGGRWMSPVATDSRLRSPPESPRSLRPPGSMPPTCNVQPCRRTKTK
eukprot:353350-Chlamydomonas_euryale.AAC.7